LISVKKLEVSIVMVVMRDLNMINAYICLNFTFVCGEKSIVFQLSNILLRGTVLLVVPFLALVADQYCKD